MKKTIFILTLLLPFGLLLAQDNLSTISQVGNGNDVTVSQIGAQNESHVLTDGNQNAESWVTQDGKGPNLSLAGQDGNGNWVDVEQHNNYDKTYDANFSVIAQQGNNNTATVDQLVVNKPMFILGGPLNSVINQDGNGNDAIVDQEGLWDNAFINQAGNRGNANQYQGTSKYYEGKAFINDAVIGQDVNTDGQATAEQHQIGLQNDAMIYQDAWNGSEAFQIQVNAKGAITTHRGVDVNVADIVQVGGGLNGAYQVQYFNNRGGDANEAILVQNGRQNYSLQYQVGGDNYSIIGQVGNKNYSNVYQNANGVADPTFLEALPY